jgi:hypothetical protein
MREMLFIVSLCVAHIVPFFVMACAIAITISKGVKNDKGMPVSDKHQKPK